MSERKCFCERCRWCEAYYPDECVAARVPFHFKQWGAWGPERGEDAAYGEWHVTGGFVESCMCEEGTGLVYRVGKQRAGRLLDGVEWSQFPEGLGGAR